MEITHREQICGHSGGKERVGQIERVALNIYISISNINSQREFAL